MVLVNETGLKTTKVMQSWFIFSALVKLQLIFLQLIPVAF